MVSDIMLNEVTNSPISSFDVYFIFSPYAPSFTLARALLIVANGESDCLITNGTKKNVAISTANNI